MLKCRMIIIVVLVILFGFTALRESGLLHLNASTTTRRSEIASGFLALDRFGQVGAVIVVDEHGERRRIPLGDGKRTLRLSVATRDSSWPIAHVLPLWKQGTSTHRLYLDVDSTIDGHSWDPWAIVIGIDATIHDRTLGIASSADYRQSIIDDLLTSITASSFDFGNQFLGVFF